MLYGCETDCLSTGKGESRHLRNCSGSCTGNFKPMTVWSTVATLVGHQETCNSQAAPAGLVWPRDPAQHFVKDLSLWLMNVKDWTGSSVQDLRPITQDKHEKTLQKDKLWSQMIQNLKNVMTHRSLHFGAWEICWYQARILLDSFSLDYQLVSWIIHFLVTRQQRVFTDGTSPTPWQRAPPHSMVVFSHLKDSKNCHTDHDGHSLVSVWDTYLHPSLFSLRCGPGDTCGAAWLNS